MKINEAVAQTLRDLGVDTLFGLIGDANLFVVDHYIRAGGDYVGAANEMGAVLMALGYASVSGRVGVATVTCGPGLTNTMTALVEGVKARSSLVLVTGDAPSAQKYHFQKARHQELVAATGAGFEGASSLESVADDLVNAFRRAVVEQRPVVFNMPPHNFQWDDTVPPRHTRLVQPRRVSRVADSDELDAAIGMIATARRPVLLAGQGVVKAGARDAVLQLARRLDAPLLTTLRAKDLFDGDPLNLGILGISAREEALDPIGVADCIVTFGASLNFITTALGSLVKDKRVVFVNDDPQEFGKHLVADANVLGDCASTAERMVYWLDEAEITPSGFASEPRVREAAAAIARPRPIRDPSTASRLNIHEVLQAVSTMIDGDCALVTDGGRHMAHAWDAFRVAEPRYFVHTTLFGAIGMGLPQGIGAAKAAPDRPTVVVVGDGGFMLGGLAEFNTAVRHGLDLIVLLLNDGSYGAEYVQFTARGMDPSIALFDWPDFAPVAQALGGQGLTVRRLDDLQAVRSAIAGRSRQGPLLIDVKLDPRHVPPSF